MEAWRLVFRTGIAPQLSDGGLKALLKVMRADDARLLQGGTCSPPPLQQTQGWPVEQADSIAFCYVMEHGGFARNETPNTYGQGCSINDAEEFFARVCRECDQLLGEPSACRWFINWWDESPRQEVFKNLSSEVVRVLIRRRIYGVPAEERRFRRKQFCERLQLPEDVEDGILTDKAEEELSIHEQCELEACLETGVTETAPVTEPGGSVKT